MRLPEEEDDTVVQFQDWLLERTQFYAKVESSADSCGLGVSSEDPRLIWDDRLEVVRDLRRFFFSPFLKDRGQVLSKTNWVMQDRRSAFSVADMQNTVIARPTKRSGEADADERPAKMLKTGLL